MDTQKFVYCFDEDLATKLLPRLKFLRQAVVGNKSCWIFINDPEMKFDTVDKTDVLLTNKLHF